MFQTKILEKIKTHILSPITFFPKIVPFMRQCWKNIVEPGGTQMTIWRIHIACWTHKSANTPQS